MTRIRNLKATTSQWETKNPVLLDGEVGYEDLGNNIIRSKTGDGLTAWNNLTYNDEDIYDDPNPTTIALGGIAKDTILEGRKVKDILKDLFGPYQIPSFNNFRINNVSSINYEVGASLLANYTLSWGFNNPENIKTDTSGLLISNKSGVFTNLSDVNASVTTYNLAVNQPYKVNIPDTITLNLRAKDIKNNNISSSNITINWLGLLRFGNRSTNSITTQNQLTGLSNSLLANKSILQRTYTIQSGYPFIAIPEFIDVTGIKFIDADNGFEFSMKLQSEWDSNLPSTISYNNGNTTYNLRIYRGEFFYNSPVNIKIEF